MQKKSYHKKFTRAFHMVMVFNLVIVRQGYTVCPKFPWLWNLVFLASPNIRDPGILVWEVRAEKSEVSGWPLPRASSCILAVAFSLRLQTPTLHFLSLTAVCLVLPLMPFLWATFCPQPSFHIPGSASLCLLAHQPSDLLVLQFFPTSPSPHPHLPHCRGCSVKLSRVSPGSSSLKNEWN